MKPRKAECIQICSDGAQRFYAQDNQGGGRYEWLCGIDRALDVKVGDKGIMVYVKGRTRGYYRFVKDKAPEGKE